jgi:proline iminopeptidase
MNNKFRTLVMAICITIIFSNTLLSSEAGEGIDKEFLVKSGGAELYLKVRGLDMKKPVLLYLHGGPGEANGPLLFQAYAGPVLEKHFVVAYLHQRGTCISPAVSAKTLTIKYFIGDVHNTVGFLQKRFHRDKVFLLGHSFGGSLGFLYLLEHEDNIEKFVCAGGAFSMAAIEGNGYRSVMEMAKKAGDDYAVKRLNEIGTPPYKTFMEGMVWRMLGMNLLAKMNEGLDKNFDMSKVISITGIEKIDPGWMNKSMVIASTMWKELGTINIEEQVKNISIPLLLIIGAKDIMVPFRILEKGYKNYGGPKEYLILEKSNHMMYVDEPELFVTKVIEFIQK